MTQSEQILELFKKYGKLSFSTLYELIPNLSKNVIRKRIYDLEKADLLEFQDTGIYTYSGEHEELRKLREENQRLLHLLRKENLYQSVTDYKFEGDIFRFGIIADSHLGSRYANFNLLNAAYDIFEKEGITQVFHAGDMTDGENMHPGHEFELLLVGFDAQLDYSLNQYPNRRGITTNLLGGNHDYSFFKNSGADICKHISDRRPDINYIGMMEGDFHIKTTNGGQALLRLWHPSLGSAYAISYHAQKYIESLSGGSKPNILIIGNFHKYEVIFYRNIHAIQPGCTQFQTQWMRSKRIAAVLGFMIVEAKLNEHGIVSLKHEFFPDYES